MAHFSRRGLQKAACTTAVAPTPARKGDHTRLEVNRWFQVTNAFRREYRWMHRLIDSYGKQAEPITIRLDPEVPVPMECFQVSRQTGNCFRRLAPPAFRHFRELVKLAISLKCTARNEPMEKPRSEKQKKVFLRIRRERESEKYFHRPFGGSEETAFSRAPALILMIPDPNATG